MLMICFLVTVDLMTNRLSSDHTCCPLASKILLQDVLQLFVDFLVE